ncbi:MAG: GFA family protein [Hyphomicrobiaceae bacterium]
MAENSNRNPQLTGGCQCGAVRYAVYAEPSDGAVICHCRMCQRAVGAPFFAAFPIKFADFAWTSGEPASFKSSSIAVRHFCARCGTTLSYHLLDDDGIDITICSLDDPERIAPTRQGGMESRLGWLDGIDDLPGGTSEQNMGDLLDGCVNHQHQQDS